MALALSKMSDADLKNLRYQVSKRLPTMYQFRRLGQIDREILMREKK
jgi:hypothetical protein